MTVLLYHYTSATVLYSILRNEIIRATDIRYMNDFEELSFGGSLFDGALHRRAEQARRAVTDDEDAVPLAERLSQLAQIRQLIVSVRGADTQTYVTCFSTEPDRLSQWRAYAPGGGYAIGFDSAVLEAGVSCLLVAPDSAWPRPSESSLLGAFSGRAEPVIYGTGNDAIEFVDQAANTLFESIGYPNATISSINEHRTIRTLARMKSNAFREEKEWRLTLQNDHEAPLGRPPLDFSVSGQLLKPYLPIQFIRTSAIRELRVGPGPDLDLRMASAKAILKLCGLNFDPIASGASLR